jgi:hypothetical protein
MNAGIRSAALSGLVFDSEIRSAALRAAPAVTRLVFAIAKRAARLQAEELGLLRRPGRGRHLAAPMLTGAALAAVAGYLSDADRRQKVQRLLVG